MVIGAGPNGLIAANLLADAGWEVLVLEKAGCAHPVSVGIAFGRPLGGLWVVV